MAEKLNVKNIAIQAAITALVIGLVNRLVPPTSKGLGMAALKGVAFLPLEHQAKFADAVTVENARNPKWLVEQSANMNPNDPNIYRNINQTTIGNAAYIALYGTNADAQRKALQVLENIRKL